MKKLTMLVATFAVGLSTTALADTVKLDIQPGKWKHEYSMSSESGVFEEAMNEVRKQLDALPAAQRRMVEDMMASQGMSLDMQGASLEICLTESDLQQGLLPQQEGCTQEVTEQSGDVFQVTFACDSNPPTSGQGTFRVHDPRTYSALVTVNTEFNGNPEILTMEQKGTWLQQECD